MTNCVDSARRPDHAPSPSTMLPTNNRILDRNIHTLGKLLIAAQQPLSAAATSQRKAA